MRLRRDLLEIDGQDSVSRALLSQCRGEAIEALPGQQISDLIAEPKKLLEVPGIGKGMQANLLMLFKDGKIEAHNSELLKKYRPSMLELAQDSRARSEDDCAHLERVSGQRSGGRGKTGA